MFRFTNVEGSSAHVDAEGRLLDASTVSPPAGRPSS